MHTERTLLLVDDSDVLYRPGTRRVLRPLTRHPQNPLIEEDKPWEGTVAYCSVYRDLDGGRYQLWYQAWHHEDGCRVCYAESEDGLHWVKPNLGIYPFRDVRDTNIVLVDKGNYGASVIADGRDPDPARRYKMAYWARGLKVAFSPDGIHWTVPFDKPLLPGAGGHAQPPTYVDEPFEQGGTRCLPISVSDVIDVAWDPRRDVFMIYAKTWLDGPKGNMFWKRAVVRTDSVDFVHWSKPQLVMASDEFDGEGGDHEMERGSVGGGSGGVQMHSGPTFFHNDVYFSLLQMLAPATTGHMPIELAVSRDGYRWQRPFRREMFLPGTGGDDFDGSVIMSNATPLFFEDVFWFYYGAYRFPWNNGAQTQVSGIGLATMPRDRFAGVRPIERYGQVTLKPMPLDGIRGITLNADASEGAVRVEVLTEDGYRARGYAAGDAIPVTADGLRQPARWQGCRLSDLPGGRYMLRIHLDDAEVYAVTLSLSGDP